MEKKHKLVIVGDSAFAEVAYEYFSWDSDYEVVGFSVEKESVWIARGPLRIRATEVQPRRASHIRSRRVHTTESLKSQTLRPGKDEGIRYRNLR